MFQRPKQPDIETDLVIIGAGVAGLNLAQLLLPHNLDFWMLGSPYQSQLTKAGILEDTSLPPNTDGLEFMEKFSEELSEKGVKTKSSYVESLEFGDEGIRVKTKYQDFIARKYVVIAIGNKQERYGFPGEQEFFGKGISDCTTCDYRLYSGKTVGTIGNQDYAIRSVNLLKKLSKKVHLFWYKNSDLPEVEEGIEVHQVDRIEAFGDEFLGKVKINDETEILLEGLFVEGRPIAANEAVIESGIAVDENNYIEISETFETSKANIFAIGDCTGKTSSYDGAKAHAEQLYVILKDKLNL